MFMGIKQDRRAGKVPHKGYLSALTLVSWLGSHCAPTSSSAASLGGIIVSNNRIKLYLRTLKIAHVAGLMRVRLSQQPVSPSSHLTGWVWRYSHFTVKEAPAEGVLQP